MTSEQLAEYVSTTVTAAVSSRIVGIGDAQYSEGDEQRLERKSPDALVQDLYEEIDDAIVYLCGLRLRISRLHGRVTEVTSQS